ncbi:Rossmann-like and DUF2520 domain-containing protein [Mucilaginibacter sp. NFR10]|uniref:Rossmann-like and DUF2520 domain-containing protein n=1 Tax=Mucilaginibacter sp. NFR10 TaxID=1566292 RepID=UPI0008715799|nr:Rossmann-like and DUF2520 domain-containing protein [Mucilaginibacter sp. NFR10]SCW41364.1 Predicted oxidoreductase, contains short-chain dehydrogenase (SDR) and DUF2520 domains [Mucilaginibacter sp. NFR10]
MNITIIGSGNVATHMAAAFKNAGHRIVQVYSRDMQHAALLAYHVAAEAVDNLDNINPDTGLFVVSVKDDAITTVVKALSAHKKLIVHTSGSTDLNSLLAFTPKAGVFYPLQTFSKIREVDFRSVPLCLEGADDGILADLKQLAFTISNNVYSVNSARRKILHLAAVFACNFPNYLYGVAQDLLAQNQMEFNMLRPLIMETAQKVLEQEPRNVQTGPAVRNDEGTMATHMQMLSEMPMLQDIYNLLSQGIIKNNKGFTAPE